MRKFFETPDGQLLEIDSSLALSKTNLKEYTVRTSNNSDELYMPVITKTDRGYSVKVNVKDEVSSESNASSYACENDECYREKIIFIELDVDGLRMKRYISDTEEPEVGFFIPHGKNVVAYSYSLKGGLWMSILKDDEVK